MYLVRFNCCRDFNFYCLIHYFKKLYNQDDISNDTFQNMGVTLWIIKFVLCATIWYESLNCFSNRFILGNCGIWNVSKGLPKTHLIFLTQNQTDGRRRIEGYGTIFWWPFRFFFWNWTRGSQNECSRYEILLRRAENIFTEMSSSLNHVYHYSAISEHSGDVGHVFVCIHCLAILIYIQIVVLWKSIFSFVCSCHSVSLVVGSFRASQLFLTCSGHLSLFYD